MHKEFVPQSQTVSQDVYKGVLHCLCDSIQSHRPKLWVTWNWLILHDNSQLHVALSFKELLSVHQLFALPHVPYSIDLPPCDFFFPVTESSTESPSLCYIQAIQGCFKDLQK